MRHLPGWKKKFQWSRRKTKYTLKRDRKKNFFVFVFLFKSNIMCVAFKFHRAKTHFLIWRRRCLHFWHYFFKPRIKKGDNREKKKKNLKTLLYNFVLGLVSSRVSLSVMLQILPQVRDKKDQSPASLSMQSPWIH